MHLGKDDFSEEVPVLDVHDLDISVQHSSSFCFLFPTPAAAARAESETVLVGSERTLLWPQTKRVPLAHQEVVQVSGDLRLLVACKYGSQ